jgi:putative heme degradation protein
MKVMEKFDGGNFHFWNFKMHMMLSKHGLWKFVDESATLPSEELAKADYNEKEMKAFALLCEHLTDAQLAHIQYYDNVRSAWEALCDVHEVKTISKKLFLRSRFFTIKM